MTLKVVFLNNLVIVPAVLYLSVLINDYTTMQSFELADLPDTWTFLCQNYFCVIIEDLVFTLIHKTLHTPFFYKHVHKWHHTYTMAIGLSAEYAHPIEFIFGNMIPLGIPCMILGHKMHYYTFMVIGTQRIISTTMGHSGYDLPWDPTEILPFRSTTRYHDYHH